MLPSEQIAVGEGESEADRAANRAGNADEKGIKKRRHGTKKPDDAIGNNGAVVLDGDLVDEDAVVDEDEDGEQRQRLDPDRLAHFDRHERLDLVESQPEFGRCADGRHEDDKEKCVFETFDLEK